MLLTVPKSFSRSGIKVKCMKCKRQISKTSRCYLDLRSTKKASNCDFQHLHKYNLIVCVPGTKSIRRSKTIDTKDFNEALSEISKFRSELKANHYVHNPVLKFNLNKENYSIVDAVVDYLDFQSGVNIPEHLKRNKSSQHIQGCERILTRFCQALKEKNYILEVFPISKLSDDEVGYFHTYLLDKLKLKKATYNGHFRIMKAFITWVIKFKQIKMHNAFSLVELKNIKQENLTISEAEYNALLEVITYDNGFTKPKTNQRSNMYFPWLKLAFQLGLETGLRREELLYLKYKDLYEVEPGKFVFKLMNRKVNRIMTGNADGDFVKSIPVTKGLMNILLNSGFPKINGEDFVLNRPSELSDDYVMKYISLGFHHYIQQVTDRPLQFKHLRKTYITSMVTKLGSNAKIFTGHSDDEVIANHYLSDAWTNANLNDFEVFNRK